MSEERSCSQCGFIPKNPRKLFLDAWNGKWKCDDLVACGKRQERAAAKAAS